MIIKGTIKLLIVFLVFLSRSISCLEYMPFDQSESDIIFLLNSTIPRTNIQQIFEETMTEIVFKTKFSQIPQILIGMISQDMKFNAIDYLITVESVTQEKALIKLNTTLNGIAYFKISYIAFVDSNIAVRSFLHYYYNPKNQTFLLSPKDSYQRKAMCFPIGMKYDQNDSSLFFSVRTNIISLTIYNTVIFPLGLSGMVAIKLNCIEYYEELNGAYKMPADFSIMNFQNIDLNNPSIKPINLNQFYGRYQPISFVGMTGIKISSSDSRVRLKTFLQYSPQLSINVTTWSLNVVDSIDFGYFQYQMINCKTSDKINNINNPQKQSCIPRCPSGQIKVTNNDFNLCQPCNSSSSYIFNNTCYDSQPDNSYCDANKICLSCYIPCQYCDKTLKNCISCLPLHYLTPC